MVPMAKQDCSQAAELLREALDREQVKAKDLPQVHWGRKNNLDLRIDQGTHTRQLLCSSA